MSLFAHQSTGAEEEKKTTMFCCVKYLDHQIANVPVSFVKKFNFEEYNAKEKRSYKVFWSRHIHSLQSEANRDQLRLLVEPPPKETWQVNHGDGYYSAIILRIEGKYLCFYNSTTITI